MKSREKKNTGPEPLPFGVTLAFSLGGLIYCFLRNRTSKPSQSPSSSRPSSDCGNQIHLSGERDDNHALKKKGGLLNSTSIRQEKYEELPQTKRHGESFTDDFSSSSIVYRDEDGYLLPEYDEFVTGFSFSDNIKDMDTLDSDENSKHNNEEEFRRLRNMVKILREREESLQIQLLEYYGLKEQETAVIELQNLLKLNNMEAKLFNLKIESLQVEKRRLEEQVADKAKLSRELETAKAKINLLNKKLRSEAEQNRENILSLKERVKKLQEEENKTIAGNNLDIQVKLQKLKDLEEEAEDLRTTNSSLRLEKSDLARNLEYVQLIATSVMDDDETTRIKKECHHLRKENEELTKKIELLQADRYSDAEELVYLRWINACLRYELRNYQPSSGRKSARELSTTLSLESEEKAKQLILQYGSTEGMTVNDRNLIEYDSDKLSSSQNSVITEAGEYSFVDILSPNKNRTKGFGKFMSLLRGKDINDHGRAPYGEARAYIEDRVLNCSGNSPRCHHSGVSTVTGTEGTTTRSTSQGSRYSLDLQRTSDERSLSIFRSTDSVAEEGVISMQRNKLDSYSENIEKSELVKYAEALKVSRHKPSKRRSVSSSF